jgi:aspartate-semialdehyde dehydrogenase
LFLGIRLPGQQWRQSVPTLSPSPPRPPRLLRSRPVVAIVGATGAVGRELLDVLERRRFPLAELRLYASPRSAGSVLLFRGQDIAVAALSEESFAGVDLALFSAGSDTAREYAPIARCALARW